VDVRDNGRQKDDPTTTPSSRCSPRPAPGSARSLGSVRDSLAPFGGELIVLTDRTARPCASCCRGRRRVRPGPRSRVPPMRTPRPSARASVRVPRSPAWLIRFSPLFAFAALGVRPDAQPAIRRSVPSSAMVNQRPTTTAPAIPAPRWRTRSTAPSRGRSRKESCRGAWWSSGGGIVFSSKERTARARSCRGACR